MMMHRATLLLLLVVALSSTCHAQQEDEVLFDGCDLPDYFSDLLSLASSDPMQWTRTQLHKLLQQTHRRVLPYTSSSEDDVWKALIDLDPGLEEDGTVRLLYKQIDFPALPHGTADTWNREHVWPKSHGVGTKGPDFTDIHHLKPADWNVNSARSNLYIGECGIAKPQSACVVPGHAEAPDTADDGRIFAPPPQARGEIARALFYMAVRYSNTDDFDLNEPNLVLTDCPSIDDNDDENHEMAYLSTLLEWHAQYPVTDRERLRNFRACARWQGNRNVFVDYPELVESIFGSPQPVLGDGLGFAACPLANDGFETTPAPDDEETIAPTLVPEVDDTDSQFYLNQTTTCSNLMAGDVMITAVNSDNPDTVVLVALTDLPGGLQLRLTDNAWTGNFLRMNEGTVELTLKEGGLAKGTVFGYENNRDDNGDGFPVLHASSWQKVQGSMALSASGDSVLIYCLADSGSGGGEVPHFLGGLTFSSGQWEEVNDHKSPQDFATDSSALPDNLKDNAGAIALPHRDNWMYVGPTTGSKASLQASLSDPQNWVGSNSERYDTSTVTRQFSVLQEDPSCAAVGSSRLQLWLVSMLLCSIALQ